jgi:hypothetical protein
MVEKKTGSQSVNLIPKFNFFLPHLLVKKTKFSNSVINNQYFCTTKIHGFFTGNFGQKNPHMVFCPHVQLDQNVILDKLIWT